MACNIQIGMPLGEPLLKYRFCAKPLKFRALIDYIAWAHETVHIYGEKLEHEQELSGHTLQSVCAWLSSEQIPENSAIVLYLMMLLVVKIVKCKSMGCSVNNEFKRVLKEVALSQHSSAGNE